jgi:predicted nucleic acid-binding protein
LAHVANFNNQFFVPDLFYIECTNTFWKYIRAGLYDAVDVPKDLATLKGLQLQSVSTMVLIEDAISISINHGISAYDASYVALSQQVGATLLTLDKKLVKALSGNSYAVRDFNEFEVPPSDSI